MNEINLISSFFTYNFLCASYKPNDHKKRDKRILNDKSCIILPFLQMR
ncbi:MAG: hypothetical protein SBU_000776 [Candidatus Syntrophoarchaeum butanivorans]|uniref:Uncharacterized protein n=1 Tax=Candidatus Syntropharchaeum butanivorans TaxID=1839936 RepID=A0A1F2P4Y3_9EURY|nr:MAG: hypothetical protein SBU_000776 [Candidatus Syntrophoarchaeum butanivorans]